MEIGMTEPMFVFVMILIASTYSVGWFSGKKEGLALGFANALGMLDDADLDKVVKRMDKENDER